MYMLTNEQRECFGLVKIEDTWELLEVKASPYDNFQTYAFVDGTQLKKCIVVGEKEYQEFTYEDEYLSDDLKFILPKTHKGKPVLLSSSNLLKRTHFGMTLAYAGEYLALYNKTSELDYYINSYDGYDPKNLEDFIEWVEKWCEETTVEDIEDIKSFANQPRKHIKYKEGDVFRYKINRRLYGYGRLILNYDLLRKNKTPFWDCLFGKPLLVSAYHIVTEDKNVSIEELAKLKSLPSGLMMDNSLYYGQFEIIGNILVDSEKEDYNIRYGHSISRDEKAVVFQQGKTFIKLDNEVVVHGGFSNNGIGFCMDVELPILLACIKENSNQPYWDWKNTFKIQDDLRNPKFIQELKDIEEQLGIEIKVNC